MSFSRSFSFSQIILSLSFPAFQLILLIQQWWHPHCKSESIVICPLIPFLFVLLNVLFFSWLRIFRSFLVQPSVSSSPGTSCHLLPPFCSAASSHSAPCVNILHVFISLSFISRSLCCWRKPLASLVSFKQTDQSLHVSLPHLFKSSSKNRACLICLVLSPLMFTL